MNRKKIQAAILACVLITGIAFLAIHYSEQTLVGNKGDSDQYNTIQSETEGENEGSKLIGPKRHDAESISEDAEEQQFERQDELQDTYIQEDRLLLAEQMDGGQYMTSRGEASRASNEKLKAVVEQPKPDAVLEDEPDTTEPINSDIDTAKEVSSEAIQATVPVSGAQETTEAAGELDLLARLITAEAQGEPYEAQVAVGAVVMNRVESSSWPDSIEGVIYQVIDDYYQFTPVVNGWINKPAQEQSVRAAREVLGGADPTNGAQFYYDDTTTNPWILAKTVSTQIGHMIFAF